jgi:glycosyltransferase involved in cell wall biosynthesis
VSVVIATYNCAGYVAQAIDSVLAQTYRDIEVLVVDDGSTDHTADVLAAYRGNPRVHLHSQPNAGQTTAKNRGIRAASGDFVAFCDADDAWLPQKLAVQIPAFARNDRIGVVYSRAAAIAPDGRRVPTEPMRVPYVSGAITEQLFKFNLVPFGTAVIRRACLNEMGDFDERYRMGIDWELWLRLSTRYEFLFVDELTYLYRIWPGQMSNNWRGRYDSAFEIMRDFEARHPGRLSPSVVRGAWADSFVARARVRAFLSQEYRAAFVDLARALRLNPANVYAWKSIGYVVKTALGGASH